MTTPNVLPSNSAYIGASSDFLKTKVDREGTPVPFSVQASVPSGSVVGTVVGLIPFNKGAMINVGSLKMASAALGASVTANVGVIYDDNVGNTNVATLFTSGSTAVAAGGVVAAAESATNLPYITTGDGWLALTIAGATTGSTGIFYAQGMLSYFNGGNQ